MVKFVIRSADAPTVKEVSASLRAKGDGSMFVEIGGYIVFVLNTNGTVSRVGGGAQDSNGLVRDAGGRVKMVDV